MAAKHLSSEPSRTTLNRLYSSGPENANCDDIIAAIEGPLREKIAQIVRETQGSGPWSNAMITRVVVSLQVIRSENPNYSPIADFAHELGASATDPHIGMLEQMLMEYEATQFGPSVSFGQIKYCTMNILQHPQTNQELAQSLGLSLDETKAIIERISWFCERAPSFVLLKNGQEFTFDWTDRTQNAYEEGTWSIKRKSKRVRASKNVKK